MNFKTVTTKHQAKHRALLGTGPGSCAGPRPMKPALEELCLSGTWIDLIQFHQNLSKLGHIGHNQQKPQSSELQLRGVIYSKQYLTITVI